MAMSITKGRWVDLTEEDEDPEEATIELCNYKWLASRDAKPQEPADEVQEFTVRLSNIPAHWTREELQAELDDNCLHGLYNFLYVPVAMGGPGAPKAVGY